MNYYQLSSFGVAVGTFSALLLYLYLYVLYREKCLGIWLIGWAVFFIRTIIYDYGLFKWQNSFIGTITYQILYIFWAVLFLYSTKLFVNQSLNNYWRFGIVMTIILSVAATIMQRPIVYKLFPTIFFACIVLFYMSRTFIAIKTQGIGKYIVGYCYFSWMIIICFIPFLYKDNDLLPDWLFLSCGIMRLMIASGTLVVYFEKTREDLVNNEKSLKKANKELNDFCHSVAHDLKSPLLSINQLAEELKSSNTINKDQNELILYIKNKSAELVEIIDHLLDLSRMTQKQMLIESIQLELMFHEVYNELLKFQPERKVDFTVKQLPVIQGDRIMLKLMVQNILSNALKYTQTREIAIIEINTEEDEDNYIISIKDNGVGFDMFYSSRLFGIFERLHTREEFEGYGIGLNICQKILQRHHGKAWMTGEVDKEAIFLFSFPKKYVNRKYT